MEISIPAPYYYINYNDYYDILLGDLMYRKFLRCINDGTCHKPTHKPESDDDLYCDLSGLLKSYNSFLEKYTQAVNAVLQQYKDIFDGIRRMGSDDPTVNKWIDDIKKNILNIRGDIEPIKFNPIQMDVSHLYVCDEIYKILRIIHEDIKKRMEIFDAITKSELLQQSLDDIYKSIFRK
jgi:hypothetical protein